MDTNKNQSLFPETRQCPLNGQCYDELYVPSELPIWKPVDHFSLSGQTLRRGNCGLISLRLQKLISTRGECMERNRDRNQSRDLVLANVSSRKRNSVQSLFAKGPQNGCHPCLSASMHCAGLPSRTNPDNFPDFPVHAMNGIQCLEVIQGSDGSDRESAAISGHRHFCNALVSWNNSNIFFGVI
jgi:hypothetical protein